MIKKYSKLALFTFITIFASISTCFAKELTLKEVSEEVLKEDSGASYYYNIGQYIFTSNHSLTLQDTMLAAETIVVKGKDNSAIYNEMATYQFDAIYNDDFEIDGYEYTNNFTGTTVPGDKLDICYINYTNICDNEEIKKPTNSVGNPVTLDLSNLSKEILKSDEGASYFYLVGQYAFTSNHTLTIEDLMLAARTIELKNSDGYTNKDAAYNLMTTYQFDASYNDDFEIDGYEYANNFTGTSIPGTSYRVCYINHNKICDDSILVDVDTLVNNAYNTIKQNEVKERFEVTLTGNTINITINDLTMNSIEALQGTGIATAATTFLDAEGIESVTLTVGETSVVITKGNLNATEIAKFLEALTGENGTAAKLDGKVITATIGFKEGYATANSDSFEIKFTNRDDIKVDVDTLVNNAYNTIKQNENKERFEVTLTENTVNITMNDLTMNSIEALQGTGIATAATTFLDDEGIESVTLTVGETSVVITKGNLNATEIAKFLEALTGENGTAVNLDGKTITATIGFKQGYATANSDSFEIKFKANILGYVDVDSLLGEAYDVIELNAAPEKFDVTLNNNTLNVKINDLTMSSVDALQGTGVATAISKFLDDEGIESLVLTSGENTLTLSKDKMSATDLYNFLTAIAGEDSKTAADLDGKTINVKVNLKQGYLKANSDSFKIAFTNRDDIKVDVDTLVNNAYNTIKQNENKERFEVTLTGNTLDIKLNDLEMDSIEALQGTGVATAAINLLNVEGIESVTLTSGDDNLVITKTSLNANDVFKFLTNLMGENGTAVNLDGKTITATIGFKQGYVTANSDSFEIKFKANILGYVDVDSLLGKAYDVIELNAAPEKFEVTLNNNTLNVKINDLTMNSETALQGTGVATAISKFLEAEGIESLVLTSGENTITLSKDKMSATDLYNFLTAIAGEDSETAADLNGKTINVKVNLKQGYLKANSDSFKIAFTNRDDIKVDVDTLVNNAYNTIKNQSATNKFEVELKDNQVNVKIIDRTMSSETALQGTGVATAISNFLDTEGVKSVTLTSGENTITVAKDNMSATDLYNFLTAIAGEDSETAADLDGTKIEATVNFELGYVTLNSTTFTLEFVTEITKVNVSNLLEEAYNVVKKEAATDKFEVELNNAEINVTINDLTMNSETALQGTGVATAISKFLEAEGVKSLTLTSGENTLTVAKDNMSATDLYNFLTAITEEGTTALDLDGKKIEVEVSFEKWYETANIKTFGIKFKANILGYVDVNTLVNNAYNVVKKEVKTDKFDVSLNKNTIDVKINDLTMSSVEALQGTGVATAMSSFLNAEGVKSVTLTSGENTITVSKDNMSATDLYNFLTALTGKEVGTAADLIGKTINVKVNFEQGYLTNNSDSFNLSIKEIERYTVSFDTNGGSIVKDETVTINKTATKPATPTKEGHSFLYWTLNGIEYNFETPVVENLKLVAEWKTNEYTVTWVVDGKSTEETYKYGETPEFKGSKSKDADIQYTYTFSKWDKELSKVTDNVTYTAVYEKTLNKYVVTYVDKDNTNLGTETVDYGTLVSSLTAPKKDNCQFDSFGVAGTTVITGATTILVNYNEVVNISNSLATELANVDTNNKMTLSVSENTINALFESENTSMMALFDPLMDLLESIATNPAYESVVLSYQGKELDLTSLDFSKLGLWDFYKKGDDATKVARFIAWVAYNSDGGSQILSLKPSDLIGKTVDVAITLKDGNVSENGNTVEDYDLVFGLMGSNN